MFDGLKNSFNSTINTGKQASEKIIGMAKELKDMPYKNLKPIHIAYLAVGIIAFAIVVFVIIPMIR